jgi:ankyrin repeat protein
MKLLIGLMCGLFLQHMQNQEKKPLIAAVRKGSVKEVQQLIESGANVNESTAEKIPDSGIDYGESPLMIAAKKANLEIMKQLIDAQANVNFITSHDQPYWGRPVLAYAIDSGSVDAVRMLIEAGAKVDEFVDTDIKVKPRVRIQPLLTYAITNRCSLEIIKALVEGGAGVNKYDAFEGWTPLMIAVVSGQTKVVDLLIEAGADVNKVNMVDRGHTARYYAKKQQNKEMVKLIDRVAKR